MKKGLIICAMILPLITFAQESVEVEVTCPKCNGKCVLQVYEPCSRCGGKALVEEQIHNGYMREVSVKDSRKPTKTNRKRCPECLKSSKKGMVKVEQDCDRCSGTGKITKVKKVFKKVK